MQGVTKRNTKQIIMQEAVDLFNEQSFKGVSLHELAGRMGISRGNLTYHFKNKDQLLSAIVDAMWGEIQSERQKSRSIPSFKNLHNEVQLYYRLQKRYGFIFLDSRLLTHPIIHKRFRELTQTSIEDNLAAISLSITIGNMKKEPYNGIYYNLAVSIWMQSFFWYAGQIIRGEKTTQDGEKMLWSMVVPHLTEQGVHSFIDFFGKEYLLTLGQPFEACSESIITF